MQVIAEKKWSHVLFDDGRGWVLTLLIGGVAEVDVSLRLTPQEVALIRADIAEVERLVARVKQGREAFADREIRPAVWP